MLRKFYKSSNCFNLYTVPEKNNFASWKHKKAILYLRKDRTFNSAIFHFGLLYE